MKKTERYLLEDTIYEIIDIDNKDLISVFSGSGMKTIVAKDIFTDKEMYFREFHFNKPLSSKEANIFINKKVKKLIKQKQEEIKRLRTLR